METLTIVPKALETLTCPIDPDIANVSSLIRQCGSVRSLTWAIVQGDDDSNQEIDGGPKSVGQSLGGIKPLGKAPGDERVSSADLDRVPFARLVRTTRFLVG